MVLRIFSFLVFFLALAPAWLFAQEGSLSGKVYDEYNRVIPGVGITLVGNRLYGTVSDAEGAFKLSLPVGNQLVIFSHIQYKRDTVSVFIRENKQQNLKVVLFQKSIYLDDVEVTSQREKDAIDPASKIDAKSARNLPSAFGDFNKVLLTLPGVAGNNELSSAYNVRGGNFDENLVYVNDIPIYRPFLANAGRQEGLSFVNPELVKDISFYPGGWEAKYGDKLSSSLNIDYKEPDYLQGRLTVGLLGGSAYIGNRISEDIQYLFGVRHSDSRYLLGTLKVQGQYFPRYTDIQSFLTFDLSRKGNQKNRTKLNWLLSYARNRYLTIPTSQTSQFGSVFQNLRIQTAFVGREELNYDTYQTGFNFSHRWTDKILSRWILSGVYTAEREYFDVEGAYRICDIDNTPGSDDFNECVVVRGVGTNYNYGRNKLQARLLNLEWRNEWLISNWSVLEGGVGLAVNDMDDELNEYAYLDSAGFLSNPFSGTGDLIESTFNSLKFKSMAYTGFIQNTFFSRDSVYALNAGVRFNYLDYNTQFLLSPRVIFRYRPKWANQTSFRLSVGRYGQPPFYRELRDLQGNIKDKVKAQVSTHYTLAMERILTWWNRPFLLSVEGYYKDMADVIPYDIDNVRLRYFAENNAVAYAYGLDFRINGEFIKDTQSWFSLGLLNTRENIEGDGRGYIRRPTDQHINLAFYFEDHIPSDATIRVYVNTVFGSGFPLGPPNDSANRNIFSGDEYYRVDLGFSKSFAVYGQKYLAALVIRAEVLNALAADNTLSYTWIQDFTGAQLAVPNSLSARFFNIKLTAAF